MKTNPIKSKIKNMSLDELKKYKIMLSNFLFEHGDIENIEQGYRTIETVHELIKAKESNDEMKENVIKNLFFE